MKSKKKSPVAPLRKILRGEKKKKEPEVKKENVPRPWQWRLYDSPDEIIAILNELTAKGYEISHVDIERQHRGGWYVIFKCEKGKS